MFIFVLINLTVFFLLKTEWGSLELFQSNLFFLSGVFLLVVSFIASAIKFNKIPFKWHYDLFATGSFLVWLSYWPPFFRIDSPLFSSYLLYFSLIVAFFSLTFMTKKQEMEQEVVQYLSWLSDSGRFNPLIIMVGVMASLAFPQHFLLYPITITLLATRFSLECCLKG